MVNTSPSGILRDYCDGYVYKNHPIFKADKKAIQLIAYFDEVELCNPLGSSNKKHKLGCVFITLGNFQPSVRSSLKAIYLVALAPSPVIVKHGMDKFLKKFVEDVNMLSCKGIEVNLSGTIRHFNVGLLAFLADNLAAHQLGGFKESMSFAYRICRTCMATKDLSAKAFLESQFILRSAKEHTQQCKRLEGPLRDHYSITYGINRCSILNDISNFSVAQNLPHDIMHDLFEGVVPRELKALLCYFCYDLQLFTVKLLNHRLVNFDYGYTETCDKPAEIDENNLKKPEGKIRQTASQMWLFASVLPFFIADLVPFDDPHWNCFLLLLKICNICTSWQISYEMVDYLRVLINEHHTSFKALYPNTTIIPKMHYMVHYPSQILAFGPLVNSWTMRYEAKLSVVKRAARHGNFKNICFTVAKRHQHELCYRLNSEDDLLRNECNGTSREVSCLQKESKQLQECVQTKLGTVCTENHTVSHPT